MASLTRILPLLLVMIASFGSRSSAQAPVDTAGVRFGLRPMFADTIQPLRLPIHLTAPWRGLGGGSEPLLSRFDSVLANRLVEDQRLRKQQRLLARLYGGGQMAAAVGLPETYQPIVEPGFLGFATSMVDLQMDGELSLEMSTERFENLRCNASQVQDPLSGCRPKFSAPRIDNRLNLRAQGTIGQRLHIDFDFNSERDYTNSNTIRVYYEGLEDEFLRRVDVGTVQFRPPPSRFLTAGIPTNNFGVSAEVEHGPLTVTGLFASQKGSVVAERTYRIGDQTVQPQDRLVRDLDYESGRFFWAVPPADLPGYPAVDPLALQGLQIPDGVRPEQVRIYRYVAALGTDAGNPNLGGIRALARNTEGSVAQQVGPLRWQLLTQGQHYWLDPSGTWFVLTARLDPNDFLAVSYLTSDGGRVGTFPATDNPGALDTLRLIVEPNRGPEAGTFHRALRNVYRVAGPDLVIPSLNVSILQNQSERPVDGVQTWLSLFGLAEANDQAVFDADNRLFPRLRDPGAIETINDRFIIFPDLEPFGDETAVPIAAQRNDSLYETPEYLLFTQGPPSRFQIRLEYQASGSGDRSMLNLEARQIREGTEQIYVDGRRLERGIDYSVSYETGFVSFLDPDFLFGTRAATVTARFEQRGFFAVAPTSIAGLSARWSLGDFGGINLVGLYQSEAAAYNRPPLGFEPTSSLIGGLSADLRFDLPGVHSLLDRLLPGSLAGRAGLEIDAEVAFSRPDPNRAGDAYLEEFENDQSIPIVLRETAWNHGSMPASAAGLEGLVGAAFDSADAVQLVWQNLVPNGRGGVVEFRPTDIDTNIVILGGGSIGTERVMFTTFHADTAGGIVGFDNRSRWSQPERDFKPRWRSMVTPLSLTGADLSRNEFLEFWMFESADRPVANNQIRLVFDLGTVDEDAFSMGPESFTINGTDTVFTGRQYLGIDELDTERSPTGTFNASIDDIGILDDRPILIGPDGSPRRVALCRRQLSNLVEVFPWGDLGARCTAGNGVLDTEDLDGDLLLNARGSGDDVFRYVVDVSDPRFLVRRGVINPDPTDSSRFAGWSLYRIPLSEADQQIGQPNIRLIRHLRITLVAPPDNGEADPVIRFGLARMRLVGAPWLDRVDRPIAGIAGSTGQPRGSVSVSSISTENIELGYVSPPGLGNSVNEVGQGPGSLGVQVNEKSLRVVATDLRAEERAEAYHRFTSGSQNLLAYREMRIWVRGRGEGWEDQRLNAFFKVGTDADNFYYYQAPASTLTWQPEMVVDLERWRELRAEIETRFLRGEGPGGAAECGGDPEAYVACSSDGYVVHLLQPGISPANLAAVQEVATGIIYVREGAPILETELWIDDIRLSRPISEVGVAMAVSTRLSAGELGAFDLSFVSQDGQFRQIGQTPSYRSTKTFRSGASLNLGRLWPGLGLAAPFIMATQHSSVDPELITGSDVRGSALAGLRRPSTSVTSFSLNARRIKADGGFLVKALVNPLSVSGNWSRSSAVTEYSEAGNQSWTTQLAWSRTFRPVQVPIGLGRVVRRLPDWLANSAGGRGISSGRLTVVPAQLRLASTLSRTAGEATAFTVPIERPSDTLLIPNRSLQHLWRNSAAVAWQPLGMLALGTSWQSTRDLRHYPDSTSIGRLAGESRKSFLGIDAGVERDRLLTSSINVTPQLASWLRPRFSTSSNFVLSRNLTSRNPVQVDGDTAGAYILPQTLNNSRVNEMGFSLDPAVLLRRIFGDTSATGRYFTRVRPIDASFSRTFTSTFDLASFDPGAGYQFALGGLDQFLSQQGVQAVGAGEIHTKVVTGGLDLPLGLSAELSLRQTLSDRYQRTSGDQFLLASTETTDWPDGRVEWTRSSSGGPLRLLTLSTGIRNRSSRSTSPSTAEGQLPAITTQESRTLSPQVRLVFQNGLALFASSSFDRGEGLNNGTVRKRSNDVVSGNVSWSVRLPAAVSSLRKPLRTSLNARVMRQSECMIDDSEEGCVTISDFRSTDLSASLETDVVGDVRGSLVVQYVLNELRQLDRKTAALNLSLILEVPLTILEGF